MPRRIESVDTNKEAAVHERDKKNRLFYDNGIACGWSPLCIGLQRGRTRIRNGSFPAYIAGGALSDEMIVFTAPDEATAQKTLENVKAHIEERSELFASYAPAEVAKLEKAYTIQKGKYVVVCVTEDIDNAKAIINQYF